MALLNRVLGALLFLLPMASAPPARPPGRSGPRGQEERTAACFAMRVAKKEGKKGKAQLKRAAELYTQGTGSPPPSRWTAFALRWWGRGERGKGMASKKGGLPPKISDAQARVIAEEWTQEGVGHGANQRPYYSLEEVSAWQGGCHLSAAAAPVRASMLPARA